MDKLDRQNDFVSIYNKYFDSLSKYVLFKSSSYSDAEDVVSTVFASFYQYVVMKDKNIDNVLSYLIRMANHELSHLYRYRSNFIESDQDDDTSIENIPDDSDIESDLLKQFQADELWAAVLNLSEIDQKILIARFRFEMKFNEIADFLGEGITESVVRLRSHRAVKKLYKYLHD